MVSKQDLLLEISDLLLLLHIVVKTREARTSKPRMAFTQIHELLRVACSG